MVGFLVIFLVTFTWISQSSCLNSQVLGLTVHNYLPPVANKQCNSVQEHIPASQDPSSLQQLCRTFWSILKQTTETLPITDNFEGAMTETILLSTKLQAFLVKS